MDGEARKQNEDALAVLMRQDMTSLLATEVNPAMQLKCDCWTFWHPYVNRWCMYPTLCHSPKIIQVQILSNVWFIPLFS